MKTNKKKDHVFADRLNEVMAEHGLNQKELIEKCTPMCKVYGLEMTPSQVSRWCSGVYIPRQDYIMIICKTLSINPAWMLGVENAEKYMDHHPKAQINYELIKDELDKLDNTDMDYVKVFLGFLAHRK